MDTEQITNNVDQLTNILLMAVQEKTELTGKLIKVNVEQKLQAVEDDSVGNVIDMFA